MVVVTITSMVRNTNTVPMPNNIKLIPSDINDPEFTQTFPSMVVDWVSVRIPVCKLYRKNVVFSM
jgi:hypothetical protein